MTVMFNCKSRCFSRLKSSKSAINVLMICGLLTLFIQICIFMIILYTSESEFHWQWFETKSFFTDPIDDLDIVKQVFTDFGSSLIIVDEIFLSKSEIFEDRISDACEVCEYLKRHTLQFAVHKPVRNEILDSLKNLNFFVTTFKNIKPEVIANDLKPGVDIAYILKRYASFFILVLHGREDNVWWFGNINSDVHAKEKLSLAGIPSSSINHIRAVKHEGLLNKFETSEREIQGTHLDFVFPKNVSKFLNESFSSKYKECNWERARKFVKVHGRSLNAADQRFRHRAWKLLTKTKVVLESLGIVFWLNSGTLLGYVRECDIIPYTKDVDIGIMADSYTDVLHQVMSDHGFHLLIRLGKPEDSFELSFTDQSGIKLDIFFFYKHPDGSFWNGGTQVKSGRKFKYTFPPFSLCWTIFQGLKFRVPCNAEKFVEANYGPNWFQPVTEWDWKTSPFNVKPNGQWPVDEWPRVIQVFR